MKKSRFTESQILAILKQGESGVPVADTVFAAKLGTRKNPIRFG